VTDFKQDHPDGLIISMDQMSLYLQATLSRVWSPVGQRPIVSITPQRDLLHWFGALCLDTGQEIALSLPDLSSQTTLHFLEHVLTVWPTQSILLFLDRAPWHRGAAIQAFLAKHPRLQLIYFPSACPQLNPQEHVWKAARNAVSHNHHFPNLSALRSAFAHFLETTIFHFRWLEKFVPLFLCGL
jgi:transposase